MTSRLQNIGLVVLAVLTAVLILLALRAASSVPEAPTSNISGASTDAQAAPGGTAGDRPDDRVATGTVSPDQVEETAGETPLAAAKEALASPDLVVVSVLGDSTSNARQEWVHRWAQDLSTQRPVTISHWDEAGQSGFVEPDVLSDTGDSSALTIWSGSQSGVDATYASDQLAVIIPESPDLILLNYGHNETVQSAASNFEELLASLRDEFGDVPVVVVLQQPQTDDANADVRAAISDWARSEGLGTIDVAKAFLETDDFTTLLQDDLHPNDDGSRLWAQTVEAVLSD